MKQFNWIFTLSIITLIAISIEVFSQKVQISDNHQGLEIIENEETEKVRRNINKIVDICSQTDDLEAIEWEIGEWVDSLSNKAEIAIFQLNSLLINSKANWKARLFSAKIIPLFPQEPKVVNNLMKVLRDINENDMLRGECALALGRMRIKDAVDLLIESLEDPSIYLRERIILALQDIGDIRAVGALIKHLDDPFWMVQVLSIRTLSMFKSEGVLESLIDKFNDNNIPDHSEIIKLQALMAIGKFKHEKATNLLINVLDNSSYGDLRLIAADELKNVRRDIAIPHLIKALNDRDELLRLHAAQSLLSLQAEETQKLIAKAKKESRNEYIRYMLEKVLIEFRR